MTVLSTKRGCAKAFYKVVMMHLNKAAKRAVQSFNLTGIRYAKDS
jgi:hypothetical protein